MEQGITGSIDNFPPVFFTIHNEAVKEERNPRSILVISELQRKGSPAVILCTATDAERFMKHVPASVAVFDCDLRINQWKPQSKGSKKPSWARVTDWGVGVGRKCATSPQFVERCARQVKILFQNVATTADSSHLPWGPAPRT